MIIILIFLANVLSGDLDHFTLRDIILKLEEFIEPSCWSRRMAQCSMLGRLPPDDRQRRQCFLTAGVLISQF